MPSELGAKFYGFFVAAQPYLLGVAALLVLFLLVAYLYLRRFSVKGFPFSTAQAVAFVRTLAAYDAIYDEDSSSPTHETVRRLSRKLEKEVSPKFFPEKVANALQQPLMRWFSRKTLDFRSPNTLQVIVGRTLSYDDQWVKYMQLKNLGGESGRQIQQVVILGSGYDIRPYRLAPILLRDRKHVRVFEADQALFQNNKVETLSGCEINMGPNSDPLVLKMENVKEAVTQKGDKDGYAEVFARSKTTSKLSPDVTYVPCNFKNKLELPTVLERAGMRANVPTLFHMEGVSMYLDYEELIETLGFVRSSSSPGSILLMDFVTKLSQTHPEACGASHVAEQIKSMGLRSGEKRGSFCIDVESPSQRMEMERRAGDRALCVFKAEAIKRRMEEKAKKSAGQAEEDEEKAFLAKLPLRLQLKLKKYRIFKENAKIISKLEIWALKHGFLLEEHITPRKMRVNMRRVSGAAMGSSGSGQEYFHMMVLRTISNKEARRRLKELRDEQADMRGKYENARKFLIEYARKRKAARAEGKEGEASGASDKVKAD